VRRHIVTSVVVLLLVTIGLGVIYPLGVTAIAAIGFRHQADGSLVERDGVVVGSSLLGQSFEDPSGEPLARYFQPRPSDAGHGYDASSSGASNLGPTNPLLIGFVAGTNTVGLDGRPSATNPFATTIDPRCVPTDPSGAPVTTPRPGQRYARTFQGAYVCDPDTVPERAIAYRAFNGLDPGAVVPVDAVTASASGLDPGISVANADDQIARVARVRRLSTGRVVALVRRYTQGRQLGVLGDPTVNVLELNLALDRIR